MVKDNEVLHNEPQTPSKAPMSKPSKTKASLLTSFSCLCSVIALVLSAYVFFNHFKSTPTLLIEPLTKAQKKLDSTNQQIIAAQQALKEKMFKLGQQIQSSMNKPQDSSINLDKNWPLFKAIYYLEAAQINADWTDNVNLSISLLEQADALLTPFNEPNLITIREALSSDIAALKAIPVLDKKSLLTQLEKAQSLVDSLTPITLKNKVRAEQEPSKPMTLPAWRIQLQDSLKSLEKLVVIRQNEDAVKPLLSPFLTPLVKESLHLSLQQIQWAVLTNDAYVFEFSIQQALSILSRNFAPEEPTTQALINQLKALQSIPFAQAKPNLRWAALPKLTQWVAELPRKTKP